MIDYERHFGVGDEVTDMLVGASRIMTRPIHHCLILVTLLVSTFPRIAGAQSEPRIFGDPIGVAVDAHGTVYVTDQLAAQVVKLSPHGAVLARWGTQGTKPGQLNVPEGIAADRVGHIYVADTWNSRIDKFSASGSLLATWKSTASRLFYRPLAVATGRNGNVYVTDNEDDWVYRLSPSGTPLRRLGQFGNPTQGQYLGPTAVAVDQRGTVYVASYNWIYTLSPAGKTLAMWGTLHPGSDPGRFRLPGGLATDAAGNVYAADTGNQRIEMLSPSGSVLHIWGGKTGAIRFREPRGIAVDARGDVYVTDLGNRRVVKLSPAGALLAIWR
jgi:DNA-binding beta-propeller fold protein YncE